MKNRIGMIQLPCPELLCLGLDRRDRDGAKRPLLDENIGLRPLGARIRELMSEKGPITVLRNKAAEILKQIQDYQQYGFQILGVIGVNRSPSCGIETTSRNGEEWAKAPTGQAGQGVFMEVFSETLSTNGISLRMIGTKTSEKERSLEKIRQFIDE
jgi:predicted secreted protein